jgi:glycosyltransferase involved in cell wall biosynthesis
MKKIRLFRVANVPGALYNVLSGQLKYISQNSDFEVIAVSKKSLNLNLITSQESVLTRGIYMTRGINPLVDVVSLFQMVYLILKYRPYIIHSHTPKAGFISMLAGCICRTPVRIHTFTGLIFPTANGLFKIILLLIDKITCLCSNVIIAESFGVRNQLLAGSVTKKDILVLCDGHINGVDLNYFNRSSISENPIFLKRSLGILDKDIVISFIGRINHDKGVDSLVSVFLSLASSHKNIKLLVVGPIDDSGRPITSKTMAELQSNPNIIYVGYQADVRKYFMITDIFVLPSFREGFPGVLLQAGALEVPSIVTDVPGSNEVISHNINGYVYPPSDDDRLTELLDHLIVHPEVRITFSRNCRSIISDKYSSMRIWSATLSLYRKYL